MRPNWPLTVQREFILSICSGLDPDDTNPVFSPLLRHIYAYTHSHQGVTGYGTSLCVWEKQAINLLHSDEHQGLACLPTTHTHTHTTNQSIQLTHTPVLPSSAALIHAEDEEERVWETTRQPGRHRWYTKIRGETNKQMFLMKKEALSTQRGFGLYRQTSHWLARHLVWSQTQMKVINETRRLWLIGEFMLLS